MHKNDFSDILFEDVRPIRRMDMEYTKGTVVSISSIAPSIIDMLVRAPGIAESAMPGQFVCLYCEDGAHLLPRPISICEAMNGHIRLVFRIVGFGTEEFSRKQPGDSILMTGPLGTGYPDFRTGNVTIVGGGIGIPPMLFLARKCKEAGMQVTTVLGFRDSRLFLNDAFSNYGRVVIATDDGSVGVHGTVVDAIREYGLDTSLVCACGPMPMLRGLSAYTESKGGTAYISLEERMACGIGACLGCITKTREIDEHSHVRNTRICTEGPVFDSRVLDFNR